MLVRRRVLAGALAISMLAVPLAAGPAQAAPPPAADPIGTGKVCEGAPQANPFTDTSQEAPGTAAAIRCLVAAGVTSGTTASTYGPGANVTRRQMALFVKRLADLFDALDVKGAIMPLPAYDGVPDYADVAAEDPEFREAIGQLHQAGIVGGRSAGRFDPAAPVSRRQMAAFVNRLQAHAVGQKFPDDADHFTDDDGDPGESDLDALATVGIFQGDGDSLVVPGGDITRRQMANVLLRHAQVLFARDLIEAPFVPPAPPAEPTAQARGTTVEVTYVRPASNPGTTTYGLERVVVDAGADGVCTTQDDVAPTTGFTPVTASQTQAQAERTWVFTADDVERGCYRFRVVARSKGGATAPSPATGRSTFVSPASDSTAPTSLAAFVTDRGAKAGVLDKGDVITIAFSEFVRVTQDASLSVLDDDLTAADIARGVGATFDLNTTSVQVGATAYLPGRVLTITLLQDPATSFPGVTAGVQLPARASGAEGISDPAGNEWSPSPVGGGGDTELEVPAAS